MSAKVDYTSTELPDDLESSFESALGRDGNWFAPVVVSGLPIGHALTREELFGPFLTITEIDQFVEQIEAGVIYINRAAGATTGAWPGVQSFCGWKRIGSMGKGGLGHWYLQGFMREQSRTIAKNPS